MSSAQDLIGPLQAAFPDANWVTDGGISYVYLPELTITTDGQERQLEGLLCPAKHGGYSTRLFLSEPISHRQANWTTHFIYGRTWHTWSWNNVPADWPLPQILAAHVRALA